MCQTCIFNCGFDMVTDIYRLFLLFVHLDEEGLVRKGGSVQAVQIHLKMSALNKAVGLNQSVCVTLAVSLS